MTYDLRTVALRQISHDPRRRRHQP